MIHHRRLYGICITSVIAAMISACQPAPSATNTPVPSVAPTETAVPTLVPLPTPIDTAALIKKGETLLYDTDFTGAEKTYQQIIAIEPENADAHAGLGLVYQWEQKYADALTETLHAVELGPDNAYAHTVLAITLIRKGALVDAIKSAEKAVALNRSDAYAHSVLAMAYMADQQYGKAKDAIEQAYALNPDSAEVVAILGSYYTSTADYARARVALEKAVQLRPRFAPYQFSMSRYWDNSERFDLARKALSDTLALAPGYVPAILRLAYLQLDQKEFDAAAGTIDHAQQLAPLSVDPPVLRALLYMAKSDNDKAEAEARKAIEIDPKDRGARTVLAQVFLERKECDQSARQYESLLSELPRNPESTIGMGMAKLCAKDTSKALEYFRKAIDLEPTNSFAYLTIAAAYQSQQRWDEADAAFAKALLYSPSGSNVHTQMSLAQPSITAKRRELLIALAQNPKTTSAHYSLAAILMLEENLDLAETHARTAIAMEPENIRAKQVLGMVLATRGKASEAVKFLQAVLDKQPENETAHLYIGVAKLDLKDYSEAKTHLETFQKLAQSSTSTSASGSSSSSSSESSSTTSPISVLISALDIGYTLDEEDAIALVTKTIQKSIKNGVRVSVEDIPNEGRSMVVTISSPVQPNDEVVYLGWTASVAAAVVSRIEPSVTGVQSKLSPNGILKAYAQADRNLIRRYIMGFDTVSQFVTNMKFMRGPGAQAMASVSQVETDAAGLRELTAKRTVPFAFVTLDDMRKHFSTSVDDKVEKLRQADQQAMILFGVLDPKSDLNKLVTNMQADQVAGYYTTKDKKMVVRKDGETSADDQMTIAHEYVHALQDQNFDLQKMDSQCKNDDECLALTSLIEGDATLSMILYRNNFVPVVDLAKARSDSANVNMATIDSVPSFMSASFIFPYEEGLNYVYKIYQNGQWTAVNKLYANPPHSTEQILHPDKYQQNHGPVEVSLPVITPTLKGDWHAVNDNVMGELGWQLIFAQHMGPGAANVAAMGWGGDHYVLLQKGSSNTYVIVMKTYWDNQAESDEFYQFTQVWMRHRTTFTEDVKNLVGPVTEHTWHDPDSSVYLKQKDRFVTLVIGSSREATDEVVAVLEK